MEFLAGLHPQIVHFPIVLFIIYTLFEILGTITKKEFLSKTAHILLLLGVLGAVAAVLTGNQAEALASSWEKHGAIIQFHAIGEHEEFANITLWFFVALLVLRTVAVLRKKFIGYIKYIFVVLALVGCYFVYQTGDHGGKLVYKYGIGTDLKKMEIDEK
ncbi:MAG TPA: DUF2231 domain-containing protein [Ignavibacteriaceae bacterium]|nr:DUF2231 domain-containing protein [Ignavibacteriaceae bacterium]